MPASSTSLAVTKPRVRHQRGALGLVADLPGHGHQALAAGGPQSPWRPGHRPPPPSSASARARCRTPRARAPPRPRGRSAPCCPGRSSAGWRSPGCRTRPWASTTGCPGTAGTGPTACRPCTTVWTSPGALSRAPSDLRAASASPARRLVRRRPRPRSRLPSALLFVLLLVVLGTRRAAPARGRGHEEGCQDPGAHRATSFRGLLRREGREPLLRLGGGGRPRELGDDTGVERAGVVAAG